MFNAAKFDETKLGLLNLHVGVVFLLNEKCKSYNKTNNITEHLDSIYHNYFYIENLKTKQKTKHKTSNTGLACIHLIICFVL